MSSSKVSPLPDWGRPKFVNNEKMKSFEKKIIYLSSYFEMVFCA